MANFSQVLMKYTGSATIKAGSAYLGSAFTLGNVMQMKTAEVKVSINGNDAFLIAFDDYGYVDTTATYIFDRECVIAFGQMVEIL